jgi:hypothetical protein
MLAIGRATPPKIAIAIGLVFISHLSHLPARTKAPVVALITPMPFLSVSLVP